ncbi:MAG: hypothetical protein AAFX46_23180 [Cyanobacteria bacterium J06636_27]
MLWTVTGETRKRYVNRANCSGESTCRILPCWISTELCQLLYKPYFAIALNGMPSNSAVDGS